MEAVGQLTGGVAHDFNNLLAVIMGNLEIMKRRMGNDTPHAELMEAALESTRRGASLTQRLLSFSRQQALRPRPTNVNGLIDDMLDLLRRTLGETIRVDMHSSQSAVHALIDRGQLEAAILNLCINARDAMPNGGKLTIETSLVHIGKGLVPQGGMNPGSYVLIEVTDTGVGMDPATLSRVFEPFFTTKDTGKGSGLGLSMAYGFAEQSIGYLALASELQRGTTARLFLPELEETTPAATSAAARGTPEPELRGQGELVLVVEDEPSVRRLTVMLVESLDYTVEEAASAQEALELLPTLEKLRLLLTDVILVGDMRGDALAGRMVQARPDMKVLLMSGYTATSLGESGIERDFPLLNKPFRRSQLAEMLREALGD